MNSQASNCADSLALFPGAHLGVLGGGQLGRMFTKSALQMGYSVTVLDPGKECPAGQIATHHLCAEYNDRQALSSIAKCDAVTIEFENIPLESLQYLTAHTRLAPKPDAVAIAQDRAREKKFARDHGIATVPYAFIEASSDVAACCQAIEFPAILKTARLGYDGKGQVVCENLADAVKAFESLGSVDCVLEQRIELDAEISVVLARGFDGSLSICPVAENQHERGILDVSIVPARVDQQLQKKAIAMASSLADALDYAGVLAVEFFISSDGEVLMNEMAPRPHNSGHYTLDATTLSQFDMQVLALCGLQLPACSLLSPVVMLNLLGDRWIANEHQSGEHGQPGEPGQPNWHNLLKDTAGSAHEVTQILHLYGKTSARAGRKMGHVNFLSPHVENAIAVAKGIKSIL